MKFLRLLRSDFQRAVCSLSFLICTLTVTVLIATSAYTQIPNVASTPHLLASGTKGNGVETVILQILPLIPFGMTFAFEWKEKTYFLYLSRIGPERYILSKIIVTTVSGALLVFLGTALSIPILRGMAPHLVIDEDFWGFCSSILEDGHIVLAYLIVILDYALTSCFSSLFGVCFSVYIPSPLAVLAAPTLLYFTIIRIGPIYVIPGIMDKYMFFNPVFWINAPYPTHSAAVELGCHLGNILLIFVVLSFFTVRKMKRRVLDD